MKYRQTEILAATDFTAAGTKSIDITLTETISRINILSRLTKSYNDTIDHPIADITKVELVDGSDVLFSMSGKEAQAVNFYDRKCPSMNLMYSYKGTHVRSMVGIDFGRYLNDPLLAFDPTRFKNPQLKISYTLVTSDAAGTPHNLKVTADVFDEFKPSPIGFLLNKNLYSYTCGDENSYEYIELPTDYLMRKLFIRPYYAGYRPWTQIKEARLDEDNLKRTPFDVDIEHYIVDKIGSWTPINELLMTSYDPGTKYRYVTPGDDFAYIVTQSGAALSGYVSGYLRGGKITYVQGSPGQEVLGRVIGFCPHQVLEFPFGDPEKIEDWFDVTKVGTLRLRLKAGSSGTSGKVDVATQQLRKY